MNMEIFADLLDDIARRYFWAKRLKCNMVKNEWDKIVGIPIASHTEIISFKDGCLTVGVDNSTWMMELSYLKDEMITKVNVFLKGAGKVNKIVFRRINRGELK